MVKYLSGSYGPEFSHRRFQTATTIKEGDVSVTTSITSVLKNNPRRLAVTIQNRGTVDVNVGFSRQISTTQSLLLTAGGGALLLNVDDDGEIVGHELWGLTALGSANLHIVELLGLPGREVE